MAHAIVQDDPHQLTFESLTGRPWQLVMLIDLAPAVDKKLVDRLDAARRRLSRGALAGEGKARKLAAGLEQLASLFDGG